MTVPTQVLTGGGGGVNKSKLKILACASSVIGHTIPVINIVKQLISRGYDVTFIAGSDFQDRIEQMGARFISIPSFNINEFQEERERRGSGPERIIFDLVKFFVEPTKFRKDILYKALEDIRSEYPSHNIVVLTESFYLGDHPMYLGAPLPKGFTKRPRTVNIHAVPYMMPSQDIAPFGTALIPDYKEESRELYRTQYKEMMDQSYAEVMKVQGETLTELGGVDYKPTFPLEILSVTADITLQMCPPSLEYKRSDVHPKIRFAGALHTRSAKRAFIPPSFWQKITSGNKKVIVVTQGTVAMNYTHLIIPTLNALAHFPDFIVVAILGHKGASLPADVTIPPNAHVIDYLPYDAILPYGSVFVMNAGYGGFIQGVLNGVPMVLAGSTEDKAEVSARGEYSGVAINLRTESPSENQILEAVKGILDDNRYKKRVIEIKQENEDM
ncbi:hypothetical protein QQS21_000341 [Conoideocrella luteorostrata]|uniref:Uncharacterized protein n=1 Tax=Conoideocrella luteorostrata TaxID=1105319 RepID=A0AAJ0FYL1_9HYPO|nr:hypothetical protein QQS21_000341 [Conoideocrella luteorostrata]